MKNKIILLILLFPVFAVAQTDTLRKSLAASVMDDLVDSWSLGISEAGTDPVDIRVFNKFKNLFDPGAIVDDEFNAHFIADSAMGSGKYIIDKAKPFDVYAHDISLEVKHLKIDSVYGQNNIPSINDDTLIFEIYRKVTAEKTRQYVLGNAGSYVYNTVKNRKRIQFDQNKDSTEMITRFLGKLNESKDAVYEFNSISLLRISMTFYERDSVYKIIKIENLYKDSVVCTNDSDFDAVLNMQDNSKYEPGDFSANGLPDYDLDGIPDAIDKCKYVYGSATNDGCPVSYFNSKIEADGFFGLEYNSIKINLPELNKLGYRDESGNDAIDVLQSHKGAWKNPGSVRSIYIGGDFSYYFGTKRKRTGFSAGVTYTGFDATYEVTDPIVYTFKASDGNDFYRRRITIHAGSTEDIKYGIMNIPVLFKYRFKESEGNPKWYFQGSIGPSLIIFRNTSNYNDTIDFEGLYQVDTVNRDKITYYDHFDPGSTWNVFITADSINNKNTNPGAMAVFTSLNSVDNHYDFGSKKSYLNRQKNLNRFAIAINARFDACYRLQEEIFLKLGVQYLYALLPANSKNYKPIDNTTDGYNSIYRGTAKSSYSAFGLNAGFVFNF